MRSRSGGPTQRLLLWWRPRRRSKDTVQGAKLPSRLCRNPRWLRLRARRFQHHRRRWSLWVGRTKGICRWRPGGTPELNPISRQLPPSRPCRPIQIEVFASVDLRLPTQGNMICILRHQNIGQPTRGPASLQSIGQIGSGVCMIVSQRVQHILGRVADDLQAGRDVLQHLRPASTAHHRTLSSLLQQAYVCGSRGVDAQAWQTLPFSARGAGAAGGGLSASPVSNSFSFNPSCSFSRAICSL
jgi:hypothetical protein